MTTDTEAAQQQGSDPSQPPEPHGAIIDALVKNLEPVIGVIANLLVRHPMFLDAISKEVLARIHGPALMNKDEAHDLLTSQVVELTEAPIPGVSTLCGTLNGQYHPKYPGQISYMIYAEGHLPDGSHGLVWQDLPEQAQLPENVTNAFRAPGIVEGKTYYINLITPRDLPSEKAEIKALGNIAKEVGHAAGT